MTLRRTGVQHTFDTLADPCLDRGVTFGYSAAASLWSRLRACCLVLYCVLGCATLPAAGSRALVIEAEGKIVGITDGDTVRILLSAADVRRLGNAADGPFQEVSVRLDQIDAPERGQVWSQQSKALLSQLVFGRTVKFKRTGRDGNYGREVGDLFVDGLWVNLEMVRQGAAWAYRQYAAQPTLLCLEEERARSATLGLWSQPQGSWVAPSAWRRGARDADALPTRDSCLAIAEEAGVGGGRGIASKGSLHVNINTASLAELQSLPGIGPVLAKRIVAGRRYRSVNDLLQIEGIGKATLASLAPLVTISDAANAIRSQ